MSSSSSRQFQKHVRISSADEFSSTYSPSFSAGTSDAVQSIVTSRKCWKTIKGKGEVVWPPQLEAALVEGLERYRPVESRSARALGRFPMRNKFISDYIFQVTGKHRTPKQVGSRLQQLRDTCEGKRILKLLSHRPGEQRSPSVEHSTPEPSSSTAPPSDRIVLDVIPPNAQWPASQAFASFRPLRAIDNTVTFRSATAIHGESRCVVTKNGAPVYNETTPLELHSSSLTPASYTNEVEAVLLYSTRLVPRYWETLCNACDISLYTISQEIVSRRPPTVYSPTGESSSHAAEERILSSVVYQFNTAQVSPPASPTSSNGDAYSYTSESSIDRRTDRLGALDSTLSAASSSMRPPHAVPSYSRYPLHPPPSHGSFDMSPPGLIRDGEEGYQSLPQSPLDAAFPGSVGLDAAALGAGADPLDTICRSYVDVEYAGAGAACQFDNSGLAAASGAAAAAYAHALPDALASANPHAYVSLP